MAAEDIEQEAEGTPGGAPFRGARTQPFWSVLSTAPALYGFGVRGSARLVRVKHRVFAVRPRMKKQRSLAADSQSPVLRLA
jgi:hypothetical protein